MKRLLFAICLVGMCHFGQTQSLANSKLSFTFLSSQPMLVWNTNESARHNSFYYTDYKVDKLQVVSVHQPSTPFDIIFYVDKSGETQYKSIGSTGPMNTKFNFQHHYDSFNPYGSVDIREALVTGVLNSIFKNSFRNIGFR